MKLPSRVLLTRLGWATGAHGASQGIRLVTNVILTRLLAPEIFGVMLLVNTLRTGIELLSDIGIGQNIVSSPNGEDRDFLDTAWTLQILRGVLLCLVFVAASGPLAALYGGGGLGAIIPVAALILVIAGLQSVGKFVAQRRQSLRTLTLFEIATGTIAAIVQIVLAWVWPTIWALVYGALIAAVIGTIASYFIVPAVRLRLRLTRPHVHDILHFGKWIFLSSILFFAAANFDRLYLGTAIPLAVLGVYGVARSLSEVLGTLVIRIGDMVVFPTVAATRGDHVALKAKLGHARLPLLVSAALGVALSVALSDAAIYLLYDARYHAAADMLPVLAAGIWFTILTTIGESVLLGIGRPIYGTIATLVKLGWLVFALPAGITLFGVAGAVGAVAVGDLVRYVPVLVAQRREGLSFLRQDIALTLLVFTLILLLRALSGLVGLTGGLSAWWIPLRAFWS